MPMRRRREESFLVNAWIEEALASEDAESDAKLAAKRSNRDSYSYDRPLLTAALDLPVRYPILSDLKELCPLLEAETSAQFE